MFIDQGWVGEGGEQQEAHVDLAVPLTICIIINKKIIIIIKITKNIMIIKTLRSGERGGKVARDFILHERGKLRKPLRTLSHPQRRQVSEESEIVLSNSFVCSLYRSDTYEFTNRTFTPILASLAELIRLNYDEAKFE